MTHKVWLEVAVNGPWSRRHQPNIPITEDDIVREAIVCAEAGAAIIHMHAYDSVTGRQRDDYEIYAPIIERIRAAVDVVCYPTIPFAGSVDSPSPLTPAQRYAAVDALVKAGLIEWVGVDPGSTNLAHYAAIAAARPGFVYANPEDHIRHGLDLARRHARTPSYAIYEPGFLRLGAALHRACPGTPVPIYRFMFSQDMAFGFPPQDWALDAYLRLLALEAPHAPWMIAGLGVEIEPLIETVVLRGGHVRVGLEDVPLGSAADNRSLVDRARRLVEAAGGALASAADMRAALTTA